MRKLSASLILAGVLILPLTRPVFAQAVPDTAFNPSLLITDEAFGDAGTFGSAAAIQDWLVSHGSVLANTSPDFLAKLKEPSDVSVKTGLEDPEPNLGRLRTAAELIYDATAKTGLNTQVILVTLQKEQSLISGSFSSSAALQTALDRALGFGCPDSQPCGSMFLGFYYQLFGNFDSTGARYLGAPASLMKSFTSTQNGVRVGRGPDVDSTNATTGQVVRTSRKGDTILLPNTLGGYAGVADNQQVTLTNFATAALYRYTPHVFNGNYNFWKYYTLWFKYPNGTIIQRIGDTGLYIINNGVKQQFSSFVATQRKIKTNQVVGVSQTEFDTYTTDKPLAPLDGTLVKGDAEATVYDVVGGVLQPISGPIFAQRKFSFGKVVTLPQAEVAGYNLGSFLPPLNGTLITGASDPTVYIINGSVKQPITAAVFASRKLSFKNLMHLSDGEVAGIATGPFLTPPDSVQIKLAGDTGIFWYKNGQKQFVSAFVYKQRSVYNFPTVILGNDEFNAIQTGAPFPPKDGTIIKGDASDAIYQISGGVKHLLTPASYKRLRYPKPTILSQGEVDGYAEGDIIAK